MSQTEVQLIKDAVIVNADISNSAAIDVSKISGAFPAAGGTITGDVTFDGETAGRDIVFDRSENSLEFADNAFIKFGTGGDFTIHHNGTNTKLVENSGNAFQIQSDDVRLQSTAGESYFIGTANGAANLYHNNSVRLQTTSTGVDILGSDTTGSNLNGDLVVNNAAGTRYAVFDASHTKLNFSDNASITVGDSNDLKIFHDGSNSKLTHDGSGGLYIGANTFALQKGDHSENYISMAADGAVELYHNGSKKLETTSGGIDLPDQLQVDGTLFATGGLKLNADNVKLRLGASDDLLIYHDNSNQNVIESVSSGEFKIKTNTNINITKASSEDIAFFKPDGAVELYFDNSKKLSTDSNGVKINSSSLYIDSDNEFIAVGAGDDLKITHDGTDNIINSVNGDLIFKHSNNIKCKVTGGDFRPSTGNNIDLGVSSAKWQNVHAITYYGDGSNLTGISGGKVLQVVSKVKTTTASNNVGSQSTWEYNDSSLMVTITGASTSNKFLFLGQLTICGEVACHVGLRDNTNSSNVTGMMATSTSNRRASTSGNSAAAVDDHSAMTVPIVGLISVPDTNQHQYYFQISHTSGATREIVLNGARNSGDNAERGRYISSLQVMEISG